MDVSIVREGVKYLLTSPLEVGRNSGRIPFGRTKRVMIIGLGDYETDGGCRRTAEIMIHMRMEGSSGVNVQLTGGDS